MSDDLILFKGVSMHPGDIVALSPAPGKTSIPEAAQVAIIGFHPDDDYLIVFVPGSLAYVSDNRRLLNLLPEHLESLHVVQEAIEAIPERSGGQQFQRHERVGCLAGGARYIGRVIAAIDGAVAATVGSDYIITGLASSFDRIQKGERAY